MKRVHTNCTAILIFISIAIIICSLSFTYAATKSELNNELENIKEETNNVKNEMSVVKNEMDDAAAAIKDIESQIADSQIKIGNISRKIKEKENEIKNQEKDLGDRLRVMYKRGSIGFFDVLFGSNDIAELISNTELLQRLYKSDVDAMSALEKEKEALQKEKEKLDSEQAVLDQKMRDVAVEKERLSAAYSKLEEKEAELAEEAEKISEEIQNLIDAEKEYSGGQFRWPVPSSQYITSYYGYRVHPVYGTPDSFHRGIDIGAYHGSSIVAAASGTVIASYYNYYGYGNMVIIDHGSGITTLYAHASSRLVSVGENVAAGQTIALIGSTGLSTGPHLHFEVREWSETVDPMNYL